jgi:hypothetical protein
MCYKGLTMGGKYGYNGMWIGGLTRPLKENIPVLNPQVNIENCILTVLDYKDNLQEAERLLNTFLRDGILTEDQGDFILDELTK